MDLTALAPAYATIVGLISSFLSSRKGKEQAELADFNAWLQDHKHLDVIAAIESNHQTTVSVKAILNQGQGELMGQLQRIDSMLAALCAKNGVFGGLAGALYPELPPNILEIILLGAPKERVFAILGAHHAQHRNTWWYRGPTGFLQIEFSESGSATSIALALSADRPDARYSVPYLDAKLGAMTLAEAMLEDGDLQYRYTMRTEELIFSARVGPPGAWTNITFGMLSPLTDGSLQSTEFIWDREAEQLLSLPDKTLINWIGLSRNSEVLWFDWSICLGY